ncbi:MAG: type 1 glutamine amidotransferase [Microbacteriaceae bacterium]
MRALFVQHDHVSPTGPVSARLREHGFDVDEVTVVDQGNFRTPNVLFEFPSLVDYDLIVPMGAPWGAWDDECIGNWLQPEISWIRRAIEQNIPVLGICFGGQLMARALGGTVGRAPAAEIGWRVIETDDASLVGAGPWFQFHYDSWTVPPASTEIARNPASSQAFSHGRSLAVQFHPELTAPALAGWLREGGADEVLADGQDPIELLARTEQEQDAAAGRTNALIDAFLERIARL